MVPESAPGTYNPDGDKITSARGAKTVAVAVTAASILLVLFFMNLREKPNVAVQRFCAAAKAEEWDKLYSMIDWDSATARVDSSTFSALANTISKTYRMQKYSIKGAEAKGDTATVKVDVTISVSTALSRHNEDKTVDVQCNYVSGEWRVKPEFSQSLLGMGTSVLKK